MPSSGVFIVGISDYCDAWCETCAFTTRCRRYAEIRPAVAAGGRTATVRQGSEIGALPPLPEPWLQEVIAEASAAASRQEMLKASARLPDPHEALHERAMTYSLWVHEWLRGSSLERALPPAPVTVISWFAPLIASKILRALEGLAREGEGGTLDPSGLAKVALVGIDRSHAAWCQLVASGRVDAVAAAPYLAELEGLRAGLEEVFPRARRFLRPGFDEPGGSTEGEQSKRPETHVNLRPVREDSRQRPTLPRTFARSTIGGSRLNFRVRNGNGCDPAPMTTGKRGVWGPAVARLSVLLEAT